MQKNKIEILLIIAFALVIFLPSLSAPFSTRGESREAIVAGNMLNDNFILPHGYGDNLPSKPPLLHWLIATTSFVFGGEVSTFSARFPVIALSTLFLIYFFNFLQSKKSSSTALIATLILASSIEWSRSSIIARVDIVLAVVLAVGLIEIFRWFESHLKGVPWLAICALSLATLTKGPVALILSGLTFVAFSLIIKNLKSGIFAALKLYGFALILPFLWYLIAYYQGGDDFFAKFWHENVSRMTSTMEDRPHSHGLFYLPSLLFLGLMPWCIFAIAPLFSEFHGIKITWLKFKQKILAADLNSYCLVTFLVFTVFYSIPESKRSVYLLPIYPFLAILLADIIKQEFYDLPRRFKLATRFYYSFLIFVGFIFASVVLFGGNLIQSVVTALRKSIDPDQLTGIIKVVDTMNHPAYLIGLLALFLLWYLLPRILARVLPALPWTFTKVLFAQGLAFFFVIGLIAPKAALMQSPKEFVARNADHFQHLEKVYTFNSENYALDVYLKPRAFKTDAINEPGFYFVERRNFARFLESLPNTLEARQIDESETPYLSPRERLSLFKVIQK